MIANRFKHILQLMEKHRPSLLPVALDRADGRAALRGNLIERVAAEILEIDELRQLRIAHRKLVKGLR